MELKAILSKLIEGEWEAIKEYNCASSKIEDERIRQVIGSIISEEEAHVGELQKLLDEVSPSTENNIESGKREIEDIRNKYQN